jgi:hypothetical protein
MNLIKKKWQQQFNRYYSGISPCYKIYEEFKLTRDFFIKWIESSFTKEMNRENYCKVWQIDHVVPSKLFDLNKKKDLHLCFHYMNIMPMLNSDNKLKGASVHFSLEFLKTREKKYPDSKELKELISICEKEIENTWNKYITNEEI